MKRFNKLQLGLVMVASMLTAQQTAPPPTAQPGTQGEPVRPTYVLGPGDQIVIRAFEVDELNDKPYRVDTEGEVNLPVLGKVHAGGLTVDQFEAALTQKLKALVKNPQVTVNVVQFRSEPVFFVGALKAPGAYTLQGRRTLVEMLASIGGTLPNSSRRIKITRQMEFGRIPLPNAVVTPDGKVSSVDISLGSLMDSISPPEDIVLQPYDRISVEKAELVYANGEVNKAGGIELGERDSISIIQLISMVGGLSKDAAPEKARILRPVLNTSRRAEIPVDLKKVLAGQVRDLPLLPNDVLYVPRAGHKLTWSTMSILAVPALSSIVYVLATKL